MDYPGNPSPSYNYSNFAENFEPFEFELSDYLVPGDGTWDNLGVENMATSSSSEKVEDNPNGFVHAAEEDYSNDNMQVNLRSDPNATYFLLLEYFFCFSISDLLVVYIFLFCRKHVKGLKEKKIERGSKVAFRTKSELEIMDDGYKWRKYGKKSVKNSPNPRNYYKCSSGGCLVKKRVERDREDASYVITTYEGVHNHHSPSSTSSSNLNSLLYYATSTEPQAAAYSNNYSHSSPSS
ncbi:hypothetical protein CDL15_Pgr001847 [Punica granatum]|uniref:WRKY domain-containing protein n=1 Tax=Punica granatum TaxID=22663 RepID=A0A218XBF5_PUNGR|nr:hypothetical protein CDL15_Pgr001847 [Punica granatum]